MSGSMGRASMTPAMASDPNRVEAPPRVTSIDRMAAESTVKKYWFGPWRQVLVLRRTPSNSTTVCWPVRPRM